MSNWWEILIAPFIAIAALAILAALMLAVAWIWEWLEDMDGR